MESPFLGHFESKARTCFATSSITRLSFVYLACFKRLLNHVDSVECEKAWGCMSPSSPQLLQSRRTPWEFLLFTFTWLTRMPLQHHNSKFILRSSSGVAIWTYRPWDNGSWSSQSDVKFNYEFALTVPFSFYRASRLAETLEDRGGQIQPWALLTSGTQPNRSWTMEVVRSVSEVLLTRINLDGRRIPTCMSWFLKR